MRVEKFSLFFPPTVWSKKVGETEYAIGSIPAGGYVKISGMNPDEELPEEVRDRAYHAQPVWKRIVVIGAGPAVNIVLAFVLLFVFFALIGPETGSRNIGSVEKGYPAQAVLKPGDRVVAVDGHRGTPRELATITASHRCPQKPPQKGCKAAKPVQVTVEAGRPRAHLLDDPDLRPRGRAHPARVLVRARAARGPRTRRGARPDRRPVLVHHQGHGRAARTAHQPGAAQGALRGGRLLRGHAPDDPQQRGGRDRHPRDHLALARDREPVPVPAAGRRAHLLGDRGEGARPAGLAAP